MEPFTLIPETVLQANSSIAISSRQMIWPNNLHPRLLPPECLYSLHLKNYKNLNFIGYSE